MSGRREKPDQGISQGISKTHTGRHPLPAPSITFKSLIPAHVLVIKVIQENTCLLFLNWLEYMREKISLAIQTIVGICLIDGLLLKTLKRFVLKECLLVHMWWSQIDTMPWKEINIWLATVPCLPWRHRSCYWNSTQHCFPILVPKELALEEFYWCQSFDI